MARRTPYHYNGNHEQYMGSETTEESDGLIDGLKTKVTALKSLTLDMGDEIKSQNLFLKDMDNDFDANWGLLSSSMSRVKRLAASGHNKYILYLLLFSFFVFFVIYCLIRFR